MSTEDETATLPADGVEDPGPNPFDVAREQASTDAEAPAATPGADEQTTPSSSTTDQPTTQEPQKPEIAPNPLAQAMAQPQAPAPAKPAANALTPEMEAIVKDPSRLKQLVNLEQLNGRQSNELGQLRQQLKPWEGLDPNQVRQLMTEREKAAQESKLNPWNRDHPKNGDFRAAREVKRFIDDAVRDLPADHQKSVRDAMEAKLSPERKQMLDAYEAHARAEQDMAPEEREDHYRQIARLESEQTFERLLHKHSLQAETRAFVTQNEAVVNKHRDVYEAAVAQDQDGNFQVPRRDLAHTIATLKEQLAAATAQRGQDARVVETARAREQITKSGAVIGRDTKAPSKAVNFMRVADEASANGESPLQAMARARQTSDD
jgi:hypothetical protein